MENEILDLVAEHRDKLAELEALVHALATIWNEHGEASQDTDPETVIARRRMTALMNLAVSSAVDAQRQCDTIFFRADREDD